MELKNLTNVLQCTYSLNTNTFIIKAFSFPHKSHITHQGASKSTSWGLFPFKIVVCKSSYVAALNKLMSVYSSSILLLMMMISVTTLLHVVKVAVNHNAL